MSDDYHVKHQEGSGWAVKRCGAPNAHPGYFRRRALAEAYGRALAHRNQVELVVHETNGKTVRHAVGTLSYATCL